jgi:hypothetical protein
MYPTICFKTGGIVDSQQREIEQMNAILDRRSRR